MAQHVFRLSGILLLLLASACGSTATDSDVASEGDSSSDAVSSDDATEAAEVDDEESSDPWENYTSPIQEFLGVDYSNFDEEDAEAEFIEQEREIQETITACMRDLGWEYQSTDTGASISFGGDFESPDGLEYGSDEWVAKYGLGITTQAFSQSQVGPDLVGYDDSEVEAFDEAMADDPNQEYVNSLSTAEQDAYYQDLYGEQPEFDETLTDEEQEELWSNYEPTGCEGEAYGEGFGFGGPEQEFYEAFGDQLDELYERVSADPRIVEVQTKLTDCLAEAGHSFSPTEDPMMQAYEMFNEDMEGLWSGLEQSFEDPFEGLDPESMSEEEINEILESMSPSGPELGADQLATLAELQTRELELAADMLACDSNFMRGGSQGELFFEVLAEYEQEFLDTNAADLAEFEGSGSE